jgi:monoamine oxidase
MRSCVIIGAGVSGLYAATLLEKADVDYVILESRVRTGGRVLSAGFSGLHVIWELPGSGLTFNPISRS